MEDQALNCDEIEERLPEYALGALSAGEMVEIAQHLADCRKHATSLDGYEAVCAGLCASVPIVDPPLLLKARLLERVTDRRAAPRRASRVARLSWAVAALAAALALALGAWGVSLQSEISRRSAELESFRALVTAAGTRMLPLETTADGGSAKGVLFLTGSQAAIWAVGLPKLKGDEVYECWWIDSADRPVSGGTFKAQGGATTWAIRAPDDAQNYHAFSMTLEPDAKDPGSQGPPVLTAEF